MSNGWFIRSEWEKHSRLAFVVSDAEKRPNTIDGEWFWMTQLIINGETKSKEFQRKKQAVLHHEKWEDYLQSKGWEAIGGAGFS